MKHSPVRWMALSLLAVLAACGTDDGPTGVDPQLLVTGSGPTYVTLCKIDFNSIFDTGPEETLGVEFGFEVDGTAGMMVPGADLTQITGDWDLYGPGGSIGPDPASESCERVWVREASYDDEYEVTITELVPDGYALRQISMYNPNGLTITRFTDFETSGGVDRSYTFKPIRSATVFFKNVKVDDPPPPPGIEGCTPGYWRQPHHYDSWVGYTPDQLYSDVFGVGPALALGEAVKAKGGGMNALMRHSVAALLNASSGDVGYPYSVDEVIAKVQAAFASGEYEAQKDEFADANELGCPLN